MKTLFQIIVPVLIMSISLCLPNAADARQQETEQKVTSWLALNAGIGTFKQADSPSAGLLAMNVLYQQNLFTLRTSIVSEIIGTGYSDVGLLYGRSLIPESSQNWFSSLSAGISYLSNSHTQLGLFGGRSGTTSTFSGIGLPLQATIHYRPLKYIGFGFTGFGNVNSDRNFWGIALGIQIGRFWD